MKRKAYFQHITGVTFYRRIIRLRVAAFLALATQLSGQHAQHAIVEWYADLSPAKASTVGARAEIASTSATGRVMVDVDFAGKTVTFRVDTKNISGVDKIELRTYSARDLLEKQAIYTIYDSHDGAFNGSLVKSVTGGTFDQVATPILNGLTAIVIKTDKNPDGEIAGKIVMHKRHPK